MLIVIIHADHIINSIFLFIWNSTLDDYIKKVILSLYKNHQYHH